MIQHQTILNVADNSGAKTVKCIKILSKSKYAKIGDSIIVSVRSIKAGYGSTGGKNQAVGKKRGANIKKGQVYRALVIRTKKGVLSNRKYKHGVSFDSNDVVLLSGPNEGSLVGTRIFGPVTRELRLKNYRKVLSHAKKML